ncbi:GNAT family N-acetyltransferase [bacterium SCSIO 12643]|nr:GNAT family N-acetyltransferase [bacterium SCSIO 12643]
MTYRSAQPSDLDQLIQLGFHTWSIFKNDLAPEFWKQLKHGLLDRSTYEPLVNASYGVVCENEQNEIIGMVFLVPSGNPTDIFPADWCYIRFLTVHPDYAGAGIGKQLTKECMDYAVQNKEHTIALHTSEMMQNAIRLYTNLGFKRLKEIPSRLGKKYWIYTYSIS